MSNDKYVNFDNIKFEENNEEYKGIYVYGTLLGKGEKPINLGSANFYKGLTNVGGKLLLTNKTLSFSSHTFLQGKTDVIINLEDITKANITSNLLISQTISVIAKGVNYRFVVYNGRDWVEKILEARNNIDKTFTQDRIKENDDYIEELQKLKKLLDEGIITQEEFDLKKRIILNI